MDKFISERCKKNQKEISLILFLFVKFFQKVWSAGCPVLVRQVHRNLSKTLWHPRSFKLHMIDHRETPALWDCETLVPIPTNDIILTQFWDGFECLDGRISNERKNEVRFLLI